MPILFSHIPKTAGTSLKKALFYPNVPSSKRRRPKGLRDMLTRQWSSYHLIEGHYAYGAHLLMRLANPLYLTILRDPLSHALSYYHFAKISSQSNTYTHPAFKFADANDIVSFYSDKRYRNMQTRYVSGIFLRKAMGYVGSSWLGRPALRKAKSNLLTKYCCYGLKERLGETLQMFAGLSGWNGELRKRHYKRASGRPSSEDISNKMREAIRAANHLDFSLYDFAKTHFENQAAYRKYVKTQ